MSETFSGYLQRLHREAGHPSTRIIAQGVGFSHTTVAELLSGRRLPAWDKAAVLIAWLGGDEERGRQLWMRTRTSIARHHLKPATPDRQLERLNNLLERIAVALEKIAER